MTDIRLTPADSEVLRAVLEHTLTELRSEMYHTDSREYREKLEGRKESLKRILDQLLVRSLR